MNLSPNLTLEEMTKSPTAKRLGILNLPGPIERNNFDRLAIQYEKIRASLGNQPIKILSGYRCLELNTHVGGSKNSYHMQGCAFDFHPPQGIGFDTAQHLIGNNPDIDFDLILEESAKDGAHWLHFQIPLPGNKGRRIIRDAFLDKQGGTITRTTVG
jgi:hypothetical protein